MTKEQIQERIDALTKERESLKITLVAYEGAIQDCNFWLEALSKADVPDVKKTTKGK